MPRFSQGDRVKQTRGTFLEGGVFVLAGCVLTVEAVHESAGETTYDLRYLDRESMPHVLKGFRESELLPVP